MDTTKSLSNNSHAGYGRLLQSARFVKRVLGRTSEVLTTSVVFLGLLGGLQSQGFMQAISTGLYGSGIAPETEQVLNE